MFFLLDSFTLQQRSIIEASNTYEQYELLALAKMEYENDSNCIGIYDGYCDEEGPFLKLRRGFMTSDYSPNCVYKKRKYKGMLTPYNETTQS